MNAIIIILLIFTAVVSAGVFLLLWGSRSKKSSESELMKSMLERMDGLKGDLGDRLRDVKEEANKSGEATTRLLTQIGRQEEAVKMVLEQTRDLKTFQDLLRPSKSRGIVGEIILENILKDKLVENKNYKRQYSFKSGEVVDFALFINDYIVPLDSKFPMESYERLVAASPEEKDTTEKAFAASVKQKVEDIRKKYILPQEKTTDFALMYIPSEGMYATILSIPSLMDYASASRVIPVSPSTLFAYLVTIEMGFRGMQIAESAKEIRSALFAFEKDISELDKKIKLIGGHMKNATNAVDEVDKNIGKIEEKLRLVTSQAKNEE
ncbi:MAG: hypothetical protein A3B75_02080 [Candidatus Terrybacteria bacterium RIFCSPHIGHO2_02_FULL_43_14]|nr:MAG: hypothetical protein A3B75_02080 [Candidatus Terrybacteria bacterium RIFCSPHIGHO2_02_FULL_43_14]